MSSVLHPVLLAGVDLNASLDGLSSTLKEAFVDEIRCTRTVASLVVENRMASWASVRELLLPLIGVSSYIDGEEHPVLILEMLLLFARCTINAASAVSDSRSVLGLLTEALDACQEMDRPISAVLSKPSSRSVLVQDCLYLKAHCLRRVSELRACARMTPPVEIADLLHQAVLSIKRSVVLGRSGQMSLDHSERHEDDAGTTRRAAELFACMNSWTEFVNRFSQQQDCMEAKRTQMFEDIVIASDSILPWRKDVLSSSWTPEQIWSCASWSVQYRLRLFSEGRSQSHRCLSVESLSTILNEIGILRQELDADGELEVLESLAELHFIRSDAWMTMANNLRYCGLPASAARIASHIASAEDDYLSGLMILADIVENSELPPRQTGELQYRIRELFVKMNEVFPQSDTGKPTIHGPCYKRCGKLWKSWRPRYLVLHTDRVDMYATEADYRKRRGCKQYHFTGKPEIWSISMWDFPGVALPECCYHGGAVGIRIGSKTLLLGFEAFGVMDQLIIGTQKACKLSRIRSICQRK
jgi:hypothetical protein